MAKYHGMSGVVFMGDYVQPVVSHCAYCRRQHAPERTNCDGCGAPKTANRAQGGFITSDRQLSQAEVARVRAAWNSQALWNPRALTNVERR